MEQGESILEAIHEEDGFEDYEDVEMVDVEEGELVEEQLQPNSVHSGVDAIVGNQESESNKLRKKKKKKKRNKKHKGGSAPDVTDINRFVLETCRRLKEKKSYMLYTAVGCLGVSALNDLVKEVDAIQACGGQMTADGRRNRTGGGILWNIIKARAPMAYTEIMKKTREFEKQFRQQNIRKGPEQNKEAYETISSVSEGSLLTPQNEHEQPGVEGTRKSVHDRIRVPVSYDDLVGDDPKNDPT